MTKGWLPQRAGSPIPVGSGDAPRYPLQHPEGMTAGTWLLDARTQLQMADSCPLTSDKSDRVQHFVDVPGCLAKGFSYLTITATNC